MKLLGISGSLTPTSRANEVIRLALDQAAAFDPEIEAELLDLRVYDLVFCGRAIRPTTRATRES